MKLLHIVALLLRYSTDKIHNLIMIIIQQLFIEYFQLSVHCFIKDDFNIVHYLSMEDAPEMELFLLLVVRGVTVFARMWAGILYS